MSDEPGISQARITEMLEITERYSRGLHKTFRLDNRSGKLAGTFVIKEEKHRGELDTLLKDFSDVLRAYDICEQLPAGVEEKFITECRFDEIERVASAEILGFLSEVRESQGDDAVYAFTIWTDILQGRWDYQISLENECKASLEQKKTRTRVYDSARGAERFKYYEFTSFGSYPGKEMRGLLDNIQEAYYENMDRFGDRFNGGQHCFELMLDTVARVLNRSHGEIAKLLLTTESFVVFPRLYDQYQLTEFRAARKTMKNSEIEYLMGHLFGDLLT